MNFLSVKWIVLRPLATDHADVLVLNESLSQLRDTSLAESINEFGFICAPLFLLVECLRCTEEFH